MRRDIVFVHIPKTAGTSVRSLLEEFTPGHTVLRDYADAPETTPELFKLIHVEKRLGDFRKHFSRNPGGILLSGHFPAERYWDYFNAESFVTYLRHPVDRVISEYVHFLNIKGWTGTLEQFARRQGARNTQARFLQHVDLDEFGFIGFSEDFESTLPALGEYLGVDLPMRRTNIGNYAAVGPELRQDEKGRAMVAELNAEDIRLYDRLRAQRLQKPRAPGGGADVEGHYMGQVQLRDGTAATGYLFNDSREFIAHVEISSGGQRLAVVAADLYREGTRVRGSRTGACAFRVNLNEILPAGRKPASLRLTFRAQGSSYELTGSPIEFALQELARKHR